MKQEHYSAPVYCDLVYQGRCFFFAVQIPEGVLIKVDIDSKTVTLGEVWSPMKEEIPTQIRMMIEEWFENALNVWL